MWCSIGKHRKAEYTVLCLLVVLFALLMGCVRIGFSEDPHRPTSKTASINPFVVTIWVSDGCPNPSTMVTLRATVANQGQQIQVIELKDQPVLDIVVGNPDTSQVRWTAGKTLTPALTRLELQPSESKTIEMHWQADGRPSVYAVFIASALSPNYRTTPSVFIGETCGMY